MKHIDFWISPDTLSTLNQLVNQHVFPSRSHAIRTAVDKLVEANKDQLTYSPLLSSHTISLNEYAQLIHPNQTTPRLCGPYLRCPRCRKVIQEFEAELRPVMWESRFYRCPQCGYVWNG